MFIKSLHAFVNRWNGKHPTPYDLFYTFNELLKEGRSVNSIAVEFGGATSLLQYWKTGGRPLMYSQIKKMDRS